MEIENLTARQTRAFLTSMDDDFKDLKIEKGLEIQEASEIRDLVKETHVLFKSAAINFLRVAADDIGIFQRNELISYF